MVGDPPMVDRKGWDSLGGLDLDRKNAGQSWEEDWVSSCGSGGSACHLFRRREKSGTWDQVWRIQREQIHEKRSWG